MTFCTRYTTLAFAVLGALSLSACKDGEDQPPNDFISDDPTAGGNDSFGGDDAAGETGGDEGTGTDGEDGGGDELDISEADIIQQEGDRLYALSTYSGLTVVDIANPDDMRALGTWETDAEPFEMYLDSAQVFVMFNDYGFWQWDEGFGEWGYDTSSRLVALDASNPANIVVKGEFQLPGRIQDSRRVGDVLYLVTLEDGYCWGCDEGSVTTVTSLDVSDPANPVQIDQLSFTPPDDNWDWQRSVESTSERMYVAARSWWWSEGVGSIIDVVDISAGDGTLVAGTQVQAAGDVFSRWQMNEFQDVLRVISQAGGGVDPLIETFTVESAQSILPLGSGNLDLPVPESLRSARFDGLRAYAITAEQTDPLFTIDLSDPANPKQVGALEIPGWVYHMEPRGDRILALGFDPGNPEGSVNVSLFDVSIFDQPSLRRRVHFGGDWASFPEDQNRIHKAFSILEDEQMLLVPFSGWTYDEGFECTSTYAGGVQIIDWMDDDLFLRGLVPARGNPRRAFTHKQRILTVSDVQLASFDFSDRDAPMARDALALAVQVDDLVAAGEVWVRLERDWWTGEQILEVVSGDDPGAPEPLGTIDLAKQADCEWGWIEDLFAVGDHVFVVQSIYAETFGDDYSYNPSARIIAVDISDPTAPTVVDSFDVPGERSWGVGQLGNISTQSSWIAQHGQHLAMLMQDPDKLEEAQVHVLDLSDPANISVAATLARPEGQTQGELSVLSDTIVSWHTEPVEGQPGKVRFYFDRLDLDGTPAWSPKVNVPGIIVAYDADAGRAYTIDFEITSTQSSASDCYNNPKYWGFDWESEDNGTCKLIHRTLEQLSVNGSQASLVESHEIEGDYGMQQLYASDSRIFAKLDKSWWEEEPDYAYHQDTQLLLVDISGDEVQIQHHDGEALGNWWWINAVAGDHAVAQSNYQSLVLVDAGDVSDPAITTSALPGWGSCYRPVIDGDTVYCPMGPYGLETVEW